MQRKNKTIQLANHHTTKELLEAIKKVKDESQKTRIRAILNIKEGLSKSEVAKRFAITRTSLRLWVKRYNEGGIDALLFSKGGRKEGNPKWDKSIFEALEKEIDKQEKCWSAPLMQKWLKDKYNINVPESTIYYHLKIRGITYKSLRPSPYKANKKAQSAFKKGG